MDEARVRVPSVLRALKWYLGYRDEDIALACGMTRSAVNNRMAGKTQCQPFELAGFAEYFGVPVGIFYTTPAEAIALCEELGIERQARRRPRGDSDTPGPPGGGSLPVGRRESTNRSRQSHSAQAA